MTEITPKFRPAISQTTLEVSVGVTQHNERPQLCTKQYPTNPPRIFLIKTERNFVVYIEKLESQKPPGMAFELKLLPFLSAEAFPTIFNVQFSARFLLLAPVTSCGG